jgi:hypothetical protein
MSVAMQMKQAHPRLFHPEFLDRCGRGIRGIFDYWEAKRGSRFAPTRGDLDPVEMKAWLPGVVIVDVVSYPDQLVYRLAGTRAVAMRGSDPTGKTVLERYFGTDRDQILENYRLAIQDRRVVYEYDHTPSRDGFLEEAETIFLPLSVDGEAVDKVLVYFEIRERA